jgi:hypothetical protein
MLAGQGEGQHDIGDYLVDGNGKTLLNTTLTSNIDLSLTTLD